MKGSKRSTQMMVGVFVTGALLLLMAVTFILGGGERLFEQEYRLVTQFNEISGLREGAPVQLAGLQVGTVEVIDFDETLSSKKVNVVLKVQTRYQKRIRENSVATIATQGLLGDKMIQVTLGNPDTRMLRDGDFLRSSPPPDFNQMLKTADELLENVNRLVQNANGVLLEVKEGDGFLNEVIYGHEGKELLHDLNLMADNFEVASHDMAAITGKINRGEGTLGALVNDATVYNDIRTLLGKANRNKLIKAIIRFTLKTKEKKLLEKE